MMGNNLTTIRIFKEDKKKLITDCKDEFLRSNPRLEGYKLTEHFMLKKVIEFYLKVGL